MMAKNEPLASLDCLLDLVPGPSAAFGLRRLRADLGRGGSGRIVRLRRDSDGHNENFGAGGNGGMDLPAVVGFLGGRVASCGVWYDQSGLGHHAEAIAAGPAFDLSPGDGRPMLRFWAPAQLRSLVTLEGVPAFSIFAVFRATSVAEATSVARWQKEGDFVVFPYHTGEVLVGIHNGPIDAVSLGVAPGDFAVYGVVWKHGAAAGFTTYRNGSLVARQAARDTPITVRHEPLFIGSYAGLGEHFAGDLVELVIWPRALSDAEIRTVSDNMCQGWAAPGSSGTAPTPELRGIELAGKIRKVLMLSEAELAQMGMDRLTAEIHEILADPVFEGWPLDKQLPMIERVREIYTGHFHASGHSLIADIERAFDRAVATPGVTLDALCLFHDLMYFLYWYIASNWDAMRGVSQVMKRVAAAIRGGAVRGLPAIVPRPLGHEPLRLGYLAQFALLGNPIGRGVGDLLELLSRYLPGAYKVVLYAWSEYDDAFLAGLSEQGVTVRRFTANSMSECISAAAEAIAADEIDILITDMNSAVPTVLFERRVAPVQIFFQNGLPFWPLANIDGVFRIEFYDPKLDGFEPDMCFNLGLGAWNQRGYEYAPPVEPARIATQRACFPDAEKLIGIYGRLAKITVDFLEIIQELLIRHPQVVALLGGTGDAEWIRHFIADRGLAGRLVLVDEYVDGHVWGHMIDVFLDTWADVTVAGREIMAKGKPIVSMRTPTHEHERAPMLIANNRAMYIDLVSRLIEDRAFYEAACTATRDFVAAQPGEREYITAVHDALNAIVDRVRSEASSMSARRAEALGSLMQPEGHVTSTDGVLSQTQHIGSASARERREAGSPDPRSVGARRPHRDLALDELVCGFVIDRLKAENRSWVETVTIDAGEKAVEVALASDVLYLPKLHLQIWRDRIVPQETDTTDYALVDLRQSVHDEEFSFPIASSDYQIWDDEVFVLSNLYSHNFYHYVEQLYQVMALEKFGFRGNYVLSGVISGGLSPQIPPFQKEFLALLGISPTRVVDVVDPTVFRQVRFVTRIAHTDVLTYRAVFLALRDALLAPELAPPFSAGERLWLARRHRLIVNSEEVHHCLERYGFTILDMEELPVARQIGAARNAEVLGGAHGAAMIHSMFLRSGRTVIECFSPKYLRPSAIEICTILDHHYFQLVQGDTPWRPYRHREEVEVNLRQLELALRSLDAGYGAPSTTASRTEAHPKPSEIGNNLSPGRLTYCSVLDELRSSAPSRVVHVDFGAGGKPVEIGAAGQVLYLPALHLQLWCNTVVPYEANFDADAFDELQENISSGAIQLTGPLDDVNEINGEVCILSNLYSNNFFHFFEELYKVTILERSGFQGRYVLSPFGDRHSPNLPPFATEFLELLGIRDDRIIVCREPTIFRSSWLTTRIGCENTIPYSNVFLTLRAALITAATAIAPGLGPRLYLERYPKRVVVNAQEVRECVTRYGFTTVDMARLPVAEQIAAAHHAEVLVGAHGSGMLHCAFLKEKATVVECFSPDFMDMFILDILHILDHRYFQIVACNRNNTAPYKYGVDVVIDCHHLELVLKHLS